MPSDKDEFIRSQDRMKDSVNQVAEELDISYIRKLQREMHLCSATCYDTRGAKRKEIDDCEENCRAKYQAVVAKVDDEFSVWQVLTLPAGVGKVSCAVGDFNGDTCPDLLVVQTFQADLNIIDKVKALFSTAETQYAAVLYLNDGNNTFTEHQICDENELEGTASPGPSPPTPLNCPIKFVDHPTLVDINGDGITDLLGFALRKAGDGKEVTELFCLQGVRLQSPPGASVKFQRCEHRFPPAPIGGVFPGFTPIFADLNRDLSAEFVFLEADKRKMVVWSQSSAGPGAASEWKVNESLSVQLPALGEGEALASPLVSDVDSDGQLDILVPVCASAKCNSVARLWCYSQQTVRTVQIDLRVWLEERKGTEQVTLEPEIDGQTIVPFRIGDFSQNGYPDLIATVTLPGGSSRTPMIFENVPDDGGYQRKFELTKKPQRILPPLNDKLSGLVMSAFFDLKEDGNLDMMVEYADEAKGSSVNFIRCDDKGDTTFLKVQVFTSTKCIDSCCEPQQSENANGVRQIKIGSGIVWHGACVSIQMTGLGDQSADGFRRTELCQLPQTGHRLLHNPFVLFGLSRGIVWHGACVSIQMTGLGDQSADGFRRTELCQLPQTGHRLLHNPFVLFGLSRTPNFVDEVQFGGPRLITEGRFQHDLIRQVVPNSRVVVIPPDAESGHWTSRLFVTPSQLIFLSLLVMATCCGLLLLMITFLHFRERQQDKKERQAQTHRFHFDAM
uniref:T-cell immunomodulatory protein n=1 Tax=Globodera pallida TaxID=36090 RepID=A0A183BUM1_GLOPA